MADMVNDTHPESEPRLSVGAPSSSVSNQVPGADTSAGLSTQEAAKRLQQHGPNMVAEEHAHPWLAVLGKFWAPVP